MLPALPTGRIGFLVTTIYIDLEAMVASSVYIVRSANMICGTNQCAWLISCGKNCVLSFCVQHNYQVKTGMKSPMPCRGYGIGVQADYCLCRGNALRLRLMRKEQKAKRDYNLVMAELVASQIPI